MSSDFKRLVKLTAQANDLTRAIYEFSAQTERKGATYECMAQVLRDAAACAANVVDELAQAKLRERSARARATPSITWRDFP